MAVDSGTGARLGRFLGIMLKCSYLTSVRCNRIENPRSQWLAVLDLKYFTKYLVKTWNKKLIIC